MSDTPVSAQALAESLTGDLGQVTQSQRDAEIQELEALIAGVPEQSVFTASRKGLLYGIGVIVLALAFCYGGLRGGGLSTGMLVLIGLFFVLGIGLVATHRNAGQATLLTLDRRHAHALNFPEPVPLTAVGDITVWQNYQAELHLEIDPATVLPAVKPARNPFYPPKSYLHRRRNKPDTLVVMAPGFRVNGKAMDNDDVLDRLVAHVAAANAQARLDALRAQR
jgi:hypothetical protein